MTTPDGLKCNTLRKIAVFCGASSGNSPEYVECARQLGQEMVRRGIGLVYGGGLTRHGSVEGSFAGVTVDFMPYLPIFLT